MKYLYTFIAAAFLTTGLCAQGFERSHFTDTKKDMLSYGGKISTDDNKKTKTDEDEEDDE